MKKIKNILFVLVALFLCAGVVYAADYVTIPDSEGEVAYREIEAIKRKIDGWSTFTADVLGVDDKYIAVGFDCPVKEPGKSLDVKGLSMEYCTGFMNVYDRTGASLDGADMSSDNGNYQLLGVTATKNGYVVLGTGDRTVDDQKEETTFILELDKELNVVNEEHLHNAVIENFSYTHIVSYEDKVVVSFDTYVFVYDAATDEVAKLLDDEGYLSGVAIDETGIYVASFSETYDTLVVKYGFDLKSVASTKLYIKDKEVEQDIGGVVNLNIIGNKLVASLSGSMTNVDGKNVPAVTDMLVTCDLDLKNVKQYPIDVTILDFVESRGEIAFVGAKSVYESTGNTPTVSKEYGDVVFNLPDLKAIAQKTVFTRGKISLDGDLVWSVDYPDTRIALRIDDAKNGVVVAADDNENAGYTIIYEYELFDVTTKTDGNGTIEVTKVEGAEGEMVEFTITPKEGYVLKKVVVTNEFGGVIEFTENKFTLPSADVEIYAEFEKVTVPNPSTGLNNPYVSLGLIAAMATGAFIILKKKKYI